MATTGFLFKDFNLLEFNQKVYDQTVIKNYIIYTDELIGDIKNDYDEKIGVIYKTINYELSEEQWRATETGLNDSIPSLVKYGVREFSYSPIPYLARLKFSRYQLFDMEQVTSLTAAWKYKTNVEIAGQTLNSMINSIDKNQILPEVTAENRSAAIDILQDSISTAYSKYPGSEIDRSLIVALPTKIINKLTGLQPTGSVFTADQLEELLKVQLSVIPEYLIPKDSEKADYAYFIFKNLITLHTVGTGSGEVHEYGPNAEEGYDWLHLVYWNRGLQFAKDFAIQKQKITITAE